MTGESTKWGRSRRVPIVIRCGHGIADGTGDFVQRYRYNVGLGRWNPTDQTAEGATWVGSSGVPASGQPSLFDDDDRREHFTARCKRCRGLVAMDANRAQSALTRLSDLGFTDVPLSVLQRVYDEVPR